MPEGMAHRPADEDRTADYAAGARSRVLTRAALAALAVLFPALPAGAGVALPQETGRPAHATSATFDELAETGGLKATGAFPFDYQFLAFHSGAPDAVALWAAASAQAGRMRGVFDGGWRYSLLVRLELFRSDSLVIDESTRTDFVLSRQVADTTTDGFPLQTVVVVPPGKYDYRLVVQDLNWPGGRSVNTIRGSLVVPAFDTSRPVLSSIAVAADSVGTFRPATDVELQLNAASIVEKGARPYIYFEAYGLTPGRGYRAEIQLSSTWVDRGRGEAFRGSYEPFQLQYQGSVPAEPSRPVRAVLRLDTEDAEPGPYEVRVRVTDLATGAQSQVRKARLKVRPPSSRTPITEIQVRTDGNTGGA